MCPLTLRQNSPCASDGSAAELYGTKEKGPCLVANCRGAKLSLWAACQVNKAWEAEPALGASTLITRRGLGAAHAAASPRDGALTSGLPAEDGLAGRRSVGLRPSAGWPVKGRRENMASHSAGIILRGNG